MRMDKPQFREIRNPACFHRDDPVAFLHQRALRSGRLLSFGCTKLSQRPKGFFTTVHPKKPWALRGHAAKN